MASLTIGCMAFSGVAAAATVESPTVVKKFKITQDRSARTYSGKIDSTKSRCRKSRKVKVILKKHRNQSVLASEKTNRKGRFSIELPAGELSKGKYFMKVRKGSYKKGGNKIVCSKAKSPTIKVS